MVKIKFLINDIIDFTFPKICIVTGEKLDENNSNDFIKDNILKNLERLSLLDLSKLKEKVNNSNSYSLFRFKDHSDIQIILHNIKYNGFKQLGFLIGEMIAKDLLEKNYTQLLNYNYIIPIPLHKSKIRERGYNQSEYISLGIKKHLKIELKNNCFIRKKDTLSQTKLNIEERRKNLKDAFTVVSDYRRLLKNKKVILVDDVITTGITVTEAVKTLKQAGISDIFIISAALTVYD